jgi:hypothetical protein
VDCKLGVTEYKVLLYITKKTYGNLGDKPANIDNKEKQRELLLDNSLKLGRYYFLELL